MALQQICQDVINYIYGIFWFLCGTAIWPIRKLKNAFISVVDYMFNTTISTVQKLLLTWSVLVTLIIFSFLLYSAFYSMYIPTAEISRPVHLAFSVCSSGVGICSFPSANVTFWNNEGTVQEFLGPGQAYTAELILVVPESQANADMGMFMVVIKMFDRAGQISATSQRSVSMSEVTIFKYKSAFLRYMDMVFLSPFYFVGLMEQKSTVTVQLLSHFVDDYYHPSVGATVEIHSHKIEFYSASLRFAAKFTGLKYFLHNWPIASAFCAFWFNLFILATGVAAVVFQRKLQLRMNARSAEDAGGRELPPLDDQNIRHYGTQTKPLDDDPEEYNLPLLQEPVDFPIPAENEEILLELRHRRVN